MSQLTTHVLDTARGRPAQGITVVLEQYTAGGSWIELARGITNADGRIPDFLPGGTHVTSGLHRLTFDTSSYFRAQGGPGFYPLVQVHVQLESEGGHYHIPLLLSPFGYSTYRGS